MILIMNPSSLGSAANRLLLLLLLGAGLVTSCADEQPADTGSVEIVVSTTILGDLVRNLVGDAAEVEVLLPIGADPHDFQVSSQQVASMLDADLIIVNGLGLEAGMEDVLEEVIADGAPVIEIGPHVDPLPLGDDPGQLDPHIWMDPLRMADAAAIIVTELADSFPSIDWSAMADRHSTELHAADDEIRLILSTVPDENRTLVTNHESLGYFADRYGFVVVATVIPGGSTLAEPSSADLAALVDVIEREEVPAIFAETIAPNSLANAVAAEADHEVAVVELFTESLGEPGSGGETLIDMLLTDARRIADSLS